MGAHGSAVPAAVTRRLVADITGASTMAAAFNAGAANSSGNVPSAAPAGTWKGSAKAPLASVRPNCSPSTVTGVSGAGRPPTDTVPRSMRASPRATGSGGSTAISGVAAVTGHRVWDGPNSVFPENRYPLWPRLLR